MLTSENLWPIEIDGVIRVIMIVMIVMRSMNVKRFSMTRGYLQTESKSVFIIQSLFGHDALNLKVTPPIPKVLDFRIRQIFNGCSRIQHQRHEKSGRITHPRV